MTTPDPTRPDPSETEAETVDLPQASPPPPPTEEGPAPAGLAGRLPSLHGFQTRGRPRPRPSSDGLPPTAPPETPSPAGTAGAESSTVFTDQPKRPEPQVDPKDFRDAVRDGVDIGFTLAGQAVGFAAAKRTGERFDRARWRPTPEEKRRVTDPAHRIAKRHVSTSTQANDVIDVCLMGAGVGAYLQRAAFDETPDPEEHHGTQP